MRAPQLPQLRAGGGIVGGAGRAERLPVRRGVGDAGQRPVDGARVQVPDGDGPVITGLVLGVDAGQQPVPQLLQRSRADRFPPCAGDGRGGHPVGALPRDQGQVPEQCVHHPGVVSGRNQRHQQGEPGRQRRGHRTPRRALDLPLQRHGRRDLIDRAGRAAQLIQPVLGQAQAGVISRMPRGLHPPVAAHHRRGYRHRLAEHHHVPGADPACPGRHQRRPAVLPQPRPGRRVQVSHPHRDYPGLAQQPRAGLFRGSGHDIRRHSRAD